MEWRAPCSRDDASFGYESGRDSLQAHSFLSDPFPLYVAPHSAHIYQNLIRARLLPVLLVLSRILHSTAETSASSCTEPEKAACARNTLRGARSLSMRSCGVGLGTSSAQIPSPRLVAHCGGGANVAPGGILMTHVMGDSMSASSSIAATWASSDAVSVSSAGEVMASPPLCPQSSPIRDSTISISHHLHMHLERASM